MSKVEEPVISSAWYSSKNKTQNKTQNFPPLQSQQDNAKTKPTTVSNTSMYVYIMIFSALYLQSTYLIDETLC